MRRGARRGKGMVEVELVDDSFAPADHGVGQAPAGRRALIRSRGCVLEQI